MKCKDCGMDITINDVTCPHCGCLQKTTGYINYDSATGNNMPLAIISLVLAFFFPIMGLILSIVTMYLERRIYTDIKTKAYKTARLGLIISITIEVGFILLITYFLSLFN